MLFIAGVSADLLESRYALAFNAVVFGALIANVMIEVYDLANISFPNPLKTFQHLKGWNTLRASCRAGANS